MPCRGGGGASVGVRCVAVVAWWGVVAGAPGEYGGRMPAYSDEEPAPPDEYGGPATYAAAPLDYGRYEHHFDISRERNRHHEDDHVGLEDLVNMNDDFPKSTTRFHPKHRTHRRNKGNRKYYMKKFRSRMDDLREPENEEDEVGDNKKSLRSHRERYAYRVTSESGPQRRRPRDRGTESGKGDEDEEPDGELPSLERSLDKWSLNRGLDRIGGKDEPLSRPALKEDPAGDYDDYQDVKRTAPRGEPVTLVTGPQEQQLVPTPPELRPFGDFGFRRASSWPRASTGTPSITVQTSITTNGTDSSVTNVSIAIALEMTSTVPIPSDKLSLVEKSILSIINKGQRKYSYSIREERSTTELPAVLQVSIELPTVQMSEPPASELRVQKTSTLSMYQWQRLAAKRILKEKYMHTMTGYTFPNWFLYNKYRYELICDRFDLNVLDAIVEQHRPAPASQARGPPLTAARSLLVFVFLFHGIN